MLFKHKKYQKILLQRNIPFPMASTLNKSYKKIEYLFKFSFDGEPTPFPLSPIKKSLPDRPSSLVELYTRFCEWNTRISTNSHFVSPSIYELLKLIYSEMLFLQ